ncbi:MAG: diguanylate cyclase (GGDEF)-like protein [Crocinitomicaceae bacterium]|jgi:diguanylate cyclase (GGDEF)-like protein
MPTLEERLLKRTDIDFVRRSVPGVVVYMIIWPMLAIPLGFYSIHPEFSYPFTYLLISIGVLRLLNAVLIQYVYEKYSFIWRSSMMTLSFLHGSSLSALLSIAIYNTNYSEMVLPIALVQGAIISGAVSSLTPKPRFTQLYLTMLIAPVVLISVISDSFFYLAPLFLILWIYHIFLARRFSIEYQRAFHIETTLKENQKKLEALTITDALTGIYNRQYFDQALDVQWDLASRSQSNLSILFLDLDFFKKINDKFGHLIGDKALCHAANLFKETTKRKSDMIARYGGEEFAIILASTPHKDALNLAESIRKKLEETPLILGERSIEMSVSIGVNTTIPSNLQNCIGFLDEADQALYEAKNSGRNKVFSATDKDISSC